MRPRDDAEVAGWLALVEDDLRIARLAVEQEPPIIGPACFHAQQAAEKAVKALLVALDDIEVPRTHDVVALSRLDAHAPRATSPFSRQAGRGQTEARGQANAQPKPSCTWASGPSKAGGPKRAARVTAKSTRSPKPSA